MHIGPRREPVHGDAGRGQSGRARSATKRWPTTFSGSSSRIPDAKIILWAHNGHIGNSDPWQGAHLERALGDDYIPVGFTTSRGRYRAVGSNNTGARQPRPDRVDTGEHRVVLRRGRAGTRGARCARIGYGIPRERVAARDAPDAIDRRVGDGRAVFPAARLPEVRAAYPHSRDDAGCADARRMEGSAERAGVISRTPTRRRSIARPIAAALLTVSMYSSSGLESATMPPAACNVVRPGPCREAPSARPWCAARARCPSRRRARRSPCRRRTARGAAARVRR